MLSIGYVLKFAGRIRPSKRCFNLICLLLISSSAYAAQSLEEIQQSSLVYLQKNLIQQGVHAENIKITVSSPDKRLRLKDCQQPLSHFIPEYAANLGNTTIGVRCTSPAWQIYLPAKVEQMIQVFVTTRNFRRGDVISMSDLKMIKKAKNHSFQALSINLNSQETFRAAKNINSGYAISQHDVCQICKGDQIELRVKSPVLTVRMFGTAMKSGVSGDFIPARNTKSKKIVTGRIVSQGILEMKL